MNKKLTLKDKKSLLNKYPIKETQLIYEFERCKKKKISIKDWLENKYNKVYPNKILYHFTYAMRLKSILDWGIIFGDTVTNRNHIDGLNAPQLTSKSKYHNITSLEDDYLKECGYLRFTISLEHNDKNIINYKEYYASKGIKDGIADPRLSKRLLDSKIEEQYFYSGHIDTSKIIAIHKYDFRTQKWLMLEEQDALKEIKEHKVVNSINSPRIFGNVFNDKTGMVEKFFEANDKNDPLLPLYRYTDYIVKKSNAQQLRKWKIAVMIINQTEAKADLDKKDSNFKINPHLNNENNWIDTILKTAVNFYNKLVPKSERVEMFDAVKDFAEESNAIGKRVFKTDGDGWEVTYPKLDYSLDEDSSTIH